MTPIETPPPAGKMRITFLSATSFKVTRSDGNFRTIKTAIDFSRDWMRLGSEFNFSNRLIQKIETAIRANMRVVKWLREGRK